MSNDEETKKRWKVCEWARKEGGGSDERQAYEDALNALDKEGYHIFEVDYDKRWVTGCLEPEELISEMPEPIGSLAEALMGRLAALRAAASTPSPTPSAAESTASRESTEDEGQRILREYTLKGQRTMHLLSGIEAVTTYVRSGDPMADQRLAAIIGQLFSTVPVEETRKSLADIEFFKEHYLKYNHNDANCESHKVFESAVSKLKARLAAHPAN